MMVSGALLWQLCLSLGSAVDHLAGLLAARDAAPLECRCGEWHWRMKSHGCGLWPNAQAAEFIPAVKSGGTDVDAGARWQTVGENCGDFKVQAEHVPKRFHVQSYFGVLDSDDEEYQSIEGSADEDLTSDSGSGRCNVESDVKRTKKKVNKRLVKSTKHDVENVVCWDGGLQVLKCGRDFGDVGNVDVVDLGNSLSASSPSCQPCADISTSERSAICVGGSSSSGVYDAGAGVCSTLELMASSDDNEDSSDVTEDNAAEECDDCWSQLCCSGGSGFDFLGRPGSDVVSSVVACDLRAEESCGDVEFLWQPKAAFDLAVVAAENGLARSMSRKVIRNRKAAASRAIDAALARAAGGSVVRQLPDDIRRLLTAAELEQMAQRHGAE